jgi:NADH:ubiquinone oxidoreductase subunit 4 (subunit M)
MLVEVRHRIERMSYMRGIVVEYQYQGDGIGIVLLVVKNLIYPIPIFYMQRCNQKQRNDRKYVFRRTQD